MTHEMVGRKEGEREGGMIGSASSSTKRLRRPREQAEKERNK